MLENPDWALNNNKNNNNKKKEKKDFEYEMIGDAWEGYKFLKYNSKMFK